MLGSIYTTNTSTTSGFPIFVVCSGRFLESGSIFGGQYLYVVADLASLCLLPSAEHGAFHLPDSFLDSLGRAIAKTKGCGGRKLALWGASSKGVIFSLQMLRHGVVPDVVIDINPAKQGKHLPVTGLPVFSPDDGISHLASGDAIFVMNSNYLSEIRALAGDGFVYHGVDQSAL